MRKGRSTLPLERAVRPGRHVRHHLDAQALHHAPEHRRLHDRPVVEVDGRGNALERARFGIALSGFARHGVEQEAQRAFHILAIDASVLLVGNAGTVVDGAEQHERGGTRPIGVDPGRHLELLEVRGAHVELPERVGVLGLEAHGGWLANHAGVIVAQTAKVAIEGRGGQPSRLQLLEAVGRVDAVLGEKFQDAHRRQVASLAVRGADLHGRHDLAPPLDFGEGHRPRPTPVDAMSVPRPSFTAQQAVQGRPTDGVEFGGRLDEGCPLGMAGGERRETPAKGRQGLDWHGTPGRHHAMPDWLGGEADAALGPLPRKTAPSSTAWPRALGVPSPFT